jgi:ferritin
MLQAISQPTGDFVSPLAAFEQALESERKVTVAINEIYALALKENDYPTQITLQWFIEEQVEEEKTAEEIVTTLKRVGDHWNSIIMLDRQLGIRTA